MGPARNYIGRVGTAITITFLLGVLHGCGGGGTGTEQPPSDAGVPHETPSAPSPGPAPSPPDMRPEAGWAGYFQIAGLASGKCLDVDA